MMLWFGRIVSISWALFGAFFLAISAILLARGAIDHAVITLLATASAAFLAITIWPRRWLHISLSKEDAERIARELTHRHEE